MTITQADREAAAALWLAQQGEPYSLHDNATVAEIRLGCHDGWDEVQAFARHRADSTRELVEAGQFLSERIAELEWTDFTDLERDWHGHVEPALARFRSALRSSQSEGAAG